MSAQHLVLYEDNSSFAKFSAWASAISSWIASAGWLAQTSDTGQVMWNSLNITAVSMSGTNMTCTYSGLTGSALRVGQALKVTGWGGGNVGNNGTFTITALGAGTFTAVNASGVNVASGGTGVVTANTTVPSNNNTVFEIWKSTDALTTFYLKVQYGSSANQNPTVFISVGTATDGAGTFVGLCTLTAQTVQGSTFASDSVTPYDCYFSGAPGRLAIMMWRNGVQPQIFAIERSLNSSGVYTGDYVTLWVAGIWANVSARSPQQCSFVFGVGSAPNSLQNGNQTGVGWMARVMPQQYTTNSQAFNDTVPIDLVAPMVGYFDYPCTSLGIGWGADFAEGVTFTTTVYGATVTYIASKNNILGGTAYFTNLGVATCMRYD